MVRLAEIVDALSSATSFGMSPEFGVTSSTVSVGNGGFTVEDYPAAAEAMPRSVAAEMETAAAAAAVAVAAAAATAAAAAAAPDDEWLGFLTDGDMSFARLQRGPSHSDHA